MPLLVSTPLFACVSEGRKTAASQRVCVTGRPTESCTKYTEAEMKRAKGKARGTQGCLGVCVCFHATDGSWQQLTANKHVPVINLDRPNVVATAETC